MKVNSNLPTGAEQSLRAEWGWAGCSHAPPAPRGLGLVAACPASLTSLMPAARDPHLPAPSTVWGQAAYLLPAHERGLREVPQRSRGGHVGEPGKHGASCPQRGCNQDSGEVVRATSEVRQERGR